MADLAFTVYLSDPKTGQPVSFGPGDDVPAWAEKLIGPHAYEGYDPDNMHTDRAEGSRSSGSKASGRKPAADAGDE